MFTKRLLGVAVAAAVMGAAGAVNASPLLQIDTSLGTAGIEHTGDPGGSVYPWPGGPGPGAGIPWRTPAGGGWPNGPGMGPDVGPPGFPPSCTGADCNLGTAGWHGAYLQLNLNGATSADVTFQFMGAGNSSRANSFWLFSDDPHTAAIDVGWWQMFQDGQSSNPTHPCPVTPNGATFPSCDKPFDGLQFPDANQYTITFTAADLVSVNGGGYIPFAFDVDGRVSGGVPQGPTNIPGQTWLFNGGTQCTGNPDTNFPNECAGFFLGADPYLVDNNNHARGAPAVYAGLTDLPCVGGGCDHDFQDMGVRITVETPEPGTLALIGVALCGLVVARRYAARAGVPG